MADYPCDWHLARYRGPSTRIYLNVFREDQEVRFKGSVCEACLGDVLTDWVTRALHQTDDGVWDPPDEAQELEGLWKASGDARDGLNGRKRR